MQISPRPIKKAFYAFHFIGHPWQSFAPKTLTIIFSKSIYPFFGNGVRFFCSTSYWRLSFTIFWWFYFAKIWWCKVTCYHLLFCYSTLFLGIVVPSFALFWLPIYSGVSLSFRLFLTFFSYDIRQEKWSGGGFSRAQSIYIILCVIK